MRDSGGENSPEIYHSPPREIAPGRATMRSQTLGDDRVRRDPSVRSPTFALASPRRPPLRRARLPRRSIDHLAPPTTSARAVLFAEGRAPMQFSHFFLTAPVRQEDPTQPDASARAGRSRDWIPAQSERSRGASKTRNASGILTDRHRSQPEFDRRSSNLPRRNHVAETFQKLRRVSRHSGTSRDVKST